MQKKKSEVKPKKTTQITTGEITSDTYTSISFDRGETRLSSMDKRNLQNLAARIRESGKEVDDIKILTWADREFKSDEASNADVILARQRAESIRNYLEEDLMTDADIDYYNMAQKPSPLARFFKTKEANVKKTFKANNDLNMLGDSKASKGLVIIEYEDGTRTNL